MTDISTGSTATCRYCGHEIVYGPWFLDGRGPNQPVWSHTRSGVKSCSTRPVGWEADSWPFATPAVQDPDEAATVRDAARQAAGQTPTIEQPETCRPVTVDGTTVLVRGSGDWTEQDQHFMAEVVRAAKRRYEAEHPAVEQLAEAQPADARLPRVQWRTELLDVDKWMPYGGAYSDPQTAADGLNRRQERRPDLKLRVVRETTTWTVEETR